MITRPLPPSPGLTLAANSCRQPAPAPAPAPDPKTAPAPGPGPALSNDQRSLADRK